MVGDIKFARRQRMAMIEAAVLWEDGVTTAVLMRLFGISRGQASLDLGTYQRLAPENIRYDRRRKAYVATSRFAPLFIRGTADEYLRLLEAAASLEGSAVLLIAPWMGGVEVVRPPTRKIDIRVLRAVHQAIRQLRQIEVVYQSMNREERKLLLEPHTLVHNEYRWHVRAYSHEHSEFRDFVLARFATEPELLGPIQAGADQDRDWNEWETLRIVPNPSLTPEQQAVVADEYGMTDGRLDLTVRRALSLYYARAMRVSTDSWSAPREERVVLGGRVGADIPPDRPGIMIGG